MLAAALAGVGVGALLLTVPLDRDGEVVSTTGAVVAGVAAAAVAWIVVTVGRRADLQLAGALTGGPAREAVAASHGGAVPQDPEVRAAALRMVSARLGLRARAGRAVVVGPVIIVLAQFGLLGVDSWVPWVLLATVIVLVTDTTRAPRRLQRRILELAPPALDRRAPGPS